MYCSLYQSLLTMSRFSFRNRKRQMMQDTVSEMGKAHQIRCTSMNSRVNSQATGSRTSS